MKIILQNGMLTIDSEGLAYSNLKGMYTTGDGHGLQTSERLEGRRGEIIALCAEVAGKVYELDLLLGNEERQVNPPTYQRAKEGADYSVGECPTCKTFQKLFGKDYWCKDCVQIKLENISMGI